MSDYAFILNTVCYNVVLGTQAFCLVLSNYLCLLQLQNSVDSLHTTALELSVHGGNFTKKTPLETLQHYSSVFIVILALIKQLYKICFLWKPFGDILMEAQHMKLP